MAKAAAQRTQENHQKEFLKIFDTLCGRHSRWEVWADFITMAAIDISNVTDKVNAAERTEAYRNIASKYDRKEHDKFVSMLAEIVMGMEQNSDQDFLGELYMACELGNDHVGQFFTPYSVCRFMAELNGDIRPEIEARGFISVCDPACGAGALLLAFANHCKANDICYHDKVLFVAQDIDCIVGLMCYIQLSLMGCSGYVVIGDTLAQPSTAYDRRGLLPCGPQSRIWYTPFFSSDIWYGRRKWAQAECLVERLITPAETCTADAGEKKPRFQKQKPAPVALNESKNGQLTFF